MKSKTLTATISRYSLIGAIHYHVWFDDYSPKSKFRKHDKFIKLKDARQFALKYVYAKNITVFE